MRVLIVIKTIRKRIETNFLHYYVILDERYIQTKLFINTSINMQFSCIFSQFSAHKITEEEQFLTEEKKNEK